MTIAPRALLAIHGPRRHRAGLARETSATHALRDRVDRVKVTGAIHARRRRRAVPAREAYEMNVVLVLVAPVKETNETHALSVRADQAHPRAGAPRARRHEVRPDRRVNESPLL